MIILIEGMKGKAFAVPDDGLSVSLGEQVQ